MNIPPQNHMPPQPIFALVGDLDHRFDHGILLESLHAGFESLSPGMSTCEQFVPLGITASNACDVSDVPPTDSPPPPRVVLHLHPPPWNVRAEDVNIAWHCCRTPDIGPRLDGEWRKCDAIVISSYNVAERLRRAYPNVEILYFPLPVPTGPDCLESEGLQIINVTCSVDLSQLSPKPFLFGTVAWPNNDQGLESTLRAYVDGFDTVDPVALVVWFVGDPVQPEFLHRIQCDLKAVCGKCSKARSAPIYLVVDWLDRAKLSGFTQACDVLLTASHWDSLHAMMHFAMRSQKSIIAPAYGTELEYCWQETVDVVAATREPLYRERDELWFSGVSWYEVSPRAFGGRMREAYERWKRGDAVSERIKNASDYVIKVCDAKRVAASICRAIHKSDAHVKIPGLSAKLECLPIQEAVGMEK